MKVFWLTLLGSLAFLVVSAAQAEGSLLGHWRSTSEKNICNMTFKDDGSFSGDLAVSGKVVWQFAGEWSLRGKKLSYLYTQSSFDKIPAGSTDADNLVEMEADHYVVETISGKLYTYFRIQ